MASLIELNTPGSQERLHADLVVLGAGPGGYTAAFRAADLGMQVILIERHATLGGVCLNVGCIPSKALLHVAKVVTEAAELKTAGVDFGSPIVDVDGVRAWKDKVVGQLTRGLAQLARQRRVTVVPGTARLVSATELVVAASGGERRITFGQLIIATGSRPLQIPGLPVDARIMDSTAALRLADIPRQLLVVGGGIIGLEMATVYHALGARITVVEALDGLLPGVDRDIVKPLAQRIARQYEDIFVGTRITGIAAEAEQLRVRFEGGKAPAEAGFDRVLIAIGRRPNGDQIGADRAGIAIDDRGFIPVDAEQRTNVPHIFAIGDIVGQPMLAHKALHEAKVAAEVAAGKKAAFTPAAIPAVAYTDPEVAWVGLSAEQARAQGVNADMSTFPWAASGRALSIGRSEGITKLVFDADTHRIIGSGIVGPGAGELIAEVALAIEMGCDAHDIGLTVHPHPTLSETIAMSAEMFAGTITDLYLPKRV
jgi:dihydrolipoamide dehydrogenase